MGILRLKTERGYNMILAIVGIILALLIGFEVADKMIKPPKQKSKDDIPTIRLLEKEDK
jgi:hypothetical protein